jgi:hypothetical protein
VTAAPATAQPGKPVAAGGRRVDRRRIAGLLVAALVLGVGAGLLWTWLAPPQTFLITEVGPFPATERSAGLVVSADAWFGVLTAAAGVLLAILAALPGMRRAPMLAVGAVGASVIQVAVTFVVGQLVANQRLVFRWAPVSEANLPERGLLVLQAWPVLVLGPMFAVMVTLVAVAFSSPPAPAPAPTDRLTDPPVT